MLTRALSLYRTLFTPVNNPRNIPDQSIIKFPSMNLDYYKPITIGTTTSNINHMIYMTGTGKIKISTASYTDNDFMIYWAIGAHSSSGNHMPVFSIVIENSDQTIQGIYPNNTTRHTGTLYDNIIVHLPAPDDSIKQYDYYLSLVNHTGAECYFDKESIMQASLLVVALPPGQS